ncbi:hypothetical protein LXA43DRAFT_878726 [Ganoderma leucocontextum]|nr:hypothetical protein LXA43DRAFT_878726 [Ganoderma leucocontextum]
MATKPQSKTKRAERNNDQLFPLFLNTFSTGAAPEFATTADKLANWLKVDKAYYPKARPKIVELLEAAHNAVRRRSPHANLPFHVSRMDDDVRAFAEPFMKLVRTVAPFYLLFSELSLQMRLRVLVQTICDDVDNFLSQQPLVRRCSTTPSIATTRTTPLSPPVQSPVAPQQPTPIAQASPIDGSVTQSTVLHSPLIQLPNPARKAADRPLRFLSNGTSSLTIKLPGRPDIRLQDFPPRTTPPSIPEASQVTAPAVSPSPVATSPTIDTMASQSTRPKAKKRKFDFSDVLEEDVKWFKHTRPPQAQEPPLPSSTTPMEVTSAPVTPVTEVQDVRATEPTRMKPLGPPISVPETTEAGTALEAGPLRAVQDTKTSVPDAKTTVPSRSPSVPSQELVAPRSRSPSGSLQVATESSLKRKAPDDEADVGTTQGVSTSHSPPQSPSILSPSITRRRTSPTPPVAAVESDTAETKSEISEPAVAALPPSGEVLPSPLSTKKKKKRRKGPPGLKFLPVNVPIKDERGERLGSGAAADDQPSASGTSKDEERVSEPEAQSIANTPPPEPTPPHIVSVPPSDLPPKGGEPAPAVLSESDSAVVSGEGVQTGTPDLLPDAMLEDTVAIAAASPDAIGVDAALQPEPNGISQAHAISEVPNQEEVAQQDGIPVEEPSQAQDLPFDDDVEMREASPAPDVAPVETSLTYPEPNGIVLESEVLDGAKVNGIATLDNHPHKAEGVPASHPVLDLPATMPAEPQEEDMNPQSSPFESNMIRLLSLERGHPSHTSSQEPVELHFTLTEEEVTQVARWNNREKTTSDLSTSMCVSLVSYPLEQCAQAFECEPDAEQGELDVVGFGRPRPWPQDGSVYVVLDVSGEHGPPRSINVAPLFGFDTIHKPVDLGECGVHPAENTLHLFQLRDHSDRIFAVVLHHPTTAQVAALQTAHDRERALEDWIEGLGRFNLTQPKLVAIPVGNVVSHS